VVVVSLPISQQYITIGDATNFSNEAAAFTFVFNEYVTTYHLRRILTTLSRSQCGIVELCELQRVVECDDNNCH